MASSNVGRREGVNNFTSITVMTQKQSCVSPEFYERIVKLRRCLNSEMVSILVLMDRAECSAQNQDQDQDNDNDGVRCSGFVTLSDIGPGRGGIHDVFHYRPLE